MSLEKHLITKPDRLLTTLERLLALTATDMGETIYKTAQLVTQALGVEKVDLFLYDAQSQNLIAQGTSATPMGNKQKAIGLDCIPLTNGGRIAQVYLTGQSYWTGQAHHDPYELTGLTEELDIKSEIAVPLDVDNQRRGVLFASSSHPDFLTEQDLRFLEAISHWVGVVIHRAELMEQYTSQARKQAEDAILHLASIVSSSDDAIISKDLNGIIVSWNAGAERMYGYRAEEAVGQPITLIFPPERQDEFLQIMERLRRGERVDHFETVRVCKDGRRLHVSITISPIRNSSGILIGASSIARDISERKALERQREAFIGLVTHELKSPLTVLQSSVQLAQRRLMRLLSQTDQLSHEQQQLLQDTLGLLARTQRPIRVQQRVINDLLDLAYIKEDKVVLHLTVFDLIELVDETVQDYRTTYQDRFLTCKLPENEAICVYADRERIQQVISNYLTNALKFAPATKPIEVGIVREAARARVWVQDQGPGLTLEQQARIWQCLYQAPQTPVQKGWKAGLGLGLYLCQQLIQRQQGEVGVESVPDEGATFWFTLPVHTE
jgi:PAS domain S-box-containing protein